METAAPEYLPPTAQERGAELRARAEAEGRRASSNADHQRIYALQTALLYCACVAGYGATEHADMQYALACIHKIAAGPLFILDGVGWPSPPATE